MTTEYLHLVELAVNLLLVPAVWRLASVLWSFNARLVRLETRFGIQDPKEGTA